MDLQQFGTWDKQTGQQWHLPGVDPQAREEHQRTFALMQRFNALANTDPQQAAAVLRELLPSGSDVPGWHAPAQVEYGCNLRIGQGVFINFNATILAQATVELGDRVMIGPNCSLITVGHPVNDHQMREGGWELAQPIRIGRNSWLGANVTVLPGVTVGENCVIGAGALVTKDIPDNSLVLGAPARVVRTLDGAQNLEREQLDGPVEGFAAGEHSF
ncbi:sugar O-acetyltransferase [Corynebacterium lizhenjunii]|uniref:Sugar O-acetyltransferase n=1 Tax=Corynebacterium lizhenjunii TaxID=2709394 RepID=A0A7T0KFA1_9CORY|nr:sugar O-acetyltransferase [Corynebacterium lizhenjunii]QPK79240.1 sugar O-acetyltransferase [Corynebacterium lizhenjunii]